MTETSNLIVSANNDWNQLVQRRIIITMTETSNLIVSAKENYYNND